MKWFRYSLEYGGEQDELLYMQDSREPEETGHELRGAEASSDWTFDDDADLDAEVEYRQRLLNAWTHGRPSEISEEETCMF